MAAANSEAQSLREIVDCKVILTPILRTWVQKSTLLLQNRRHAEVLKKTREIRHAGAAPLCTWVPPPPPPPRFQDNKFLWRHTWHVKGFRVYHTLFDLLLVWDLPWWPGRLTCCHWLLIISYHLPGSNPGVECRLGHMRELPVIWWIKLEFRVAVYPVFAKYPTCEFDQCCHLFLPLPGQRGPAWKLSVCSRLQEKTSRATLAEAPSIADSQVLMIWFRYQFSYISSSRGRQGCLWYRGAWTRVLENDISYTRGQNFHLGTSLWRVPWWKFCPRV